MVGNQTTTVVVAKRGKKRQKEMRSKKVKELE